MSVELERIVVRLVGDASSYTKMVDEAKDRTEVLVSSITALAGATSVLNDIARGSIDAFARFDLAMTQSTSIMKVTKEQTDNMRRAALDLSTKLPFSAQQVAKAFYVLASAGYTAEQAIALMPQVANFAVAGATDLSYAATLAAGSQSALGLKSKDVAQNLREFTHVTDVLTRANNLAEGSMVDFANALSRSAAATLKSYNKTVEEGVAVLMVYHSQNLKGKTAGEHLGRLYRQLAGAATTHRKAHEDFNFEVFDRLTGKYRNIADIIENLEQIMKGVTDESRPFILDQLGFKSLHQKAILPLIGSSQQIRENMAGLGDQTVTTVGVTTKQMAAFSNQMQIINNQVENVAIGIGEQLAPAVKFLGEVTSVAVKFWQELPESVRTGAIAAGLGVIAFVALAGAIALAGTVFNVLFGGAPLLIGTIITGIYASAVGLTLLVAKFGGLQELIDEVKTSIMEWWEFMKPARLAFLSFFTSLLSMARVAFNAIRNSINAVWSEIVGNTTIDWAFIRDTIVETMIAAEYYILNFGKVWTATWTQAVIVLLKPLQLINRMMEALGQRDAILPGLDETRKELEDMRDEAAKAFIFGFGRFRADKWKEFTQNLFPPDRVNRAAEDAQKAGEDITRGLTRGAEQELKKFDNVLFRSQEAARRIQEYRESIGSVGLAFGANVRRGREAGGQIVPLPRFDPNQRQAPDLRNARASAEELILLRRIADAAEKNAGGPRIRIEDAELT